MPHLPDSLVHRHIGDPIEYVIPIDGLEAASVQQAWWRAAGAATVSKTLGSGVTVIDGATAKSTYPELDLTDDDGDPISDTLAVLVVDVDPADTTAIGIGRWLWQAASGGAEAPVTADGTLVLSKTIAAS